MPGGGGMKGGMNGGIIPGGGMGGGTGGGGTNVFGTPPGMPENRILIHESYWNDNTIWFNYYA